MAQVVELLVCIHLSIQMSIPGVYQKFRIMRTIIPACLIKQLDGALSIRAKVQISGLNE